MKYSLFGALLGCTALLPAVAMAAEPPTPPAQVQPPAAVEKTVPGGTAQTGEITVQQPPAQVHVTQPQPSVAVRQANPEVIVRQPPPTVTVQIPQPEIIVRMTKPEVSVTTPPPQVSVNEAKPQVQVETAKPQVNVSAQQQAANVQMLQEGRPTVRYEQTGEPKVVINRAEGQPQIRYEQVAETGKQPGMPAGAANDKAFATKAAQGGLAEVMIGQLALQKSGSPEVKQFGQTLANDHMQANKELEQIARAENITLPSQIGSDEQQETAKLQNLSGADFDKELVQNEIKDHQKDIAEFQQEAQSGADPALKAFAQKTLPVLQKHLQMAESLSRQR